VGQSIDHDVVLDRLLQVVRLDRHALHVEAHGVSVHRDAEIEALHQVLVTERPADVGAEGETDIANDFGHTGRGWYRGPTPVVSRDQRGASRAARTRSRANDATAIPA